MRLFTQMELLSPRCTPLTTVFLSFSASSPACWHFVGTESYSAYMVMNSKGEKGCESPTCLWVTKWSLIFFGSCRRGWVVSFLRRSIWYPRFARCYWIYLIGELRREWMLSKWDLSELRLRRGRCNGVVDLLICNTRNEDSLIMKNELATPNCWSFQKFSPAQRFTWIDTYGTSNYIRTNKNLRRLFI